MNGWTYIKEMRSFHMMMNMIYNKLNVRIQMMNAYIAIMGAFTKVWKSAALPAQ